MTVTLKLSIDLGLGEDESFTVQKLVGSFTVHKLVGNPETVKAMLRAAVEWLDSHAPMAEAFEDLKTLAKKEANKT
jgi:hypothetical protein